MPFLEALSHSEIVVSDIVKCTFYSNLMTSGFQVPKYDFRLNILKEFGNGIHFILHQKYPFKGKNEQSPWLLLINSA